MKTLHKILTASLLLLYAGTTGCKEMQAIDTPGLVVFASGLTTPVCITHADDSRLFVVDQHGLVMLLDSGGNVNPVPFMDISSRVVYGGERGLLGIAFHPNYKTNGYFYVNYVGKGDSTHISRFSVSATDPDKADPASELNLMTIYQPFSNHKGGDLCFGPDGYLYIGLGDGGSGGDPGNRAQNLMLLLGKMLRIDVDRGNPYAIPATNPFYASLSVRNEIWAYGLRNPWRFSFDRLTGDLWIADVGQTAYEEIDFQPAASTGGENYGWRCYEGNTAYNTDGCNAPSNYTFPVYAYPHGSECSTTGGYVYRYSTTSAFYGYYFFADYCSDKIWTLHKVSGNWVAETFGQFTGNNFSTFGEDMAGRLYVAGHTSGTIYRITDNVMGVDKKENTPDLKIVNLNGSIKVITGLNDGAEMYLTLFDAIGVNRFSSNTHASNYEFDISSLSQGIYFLSVTFNGKNRVHKLIIH
ncbi:MAG TPA: PQQ-dependent sugar dehydrogenase [Paludibacter sp.]|nr:PQQ-dependent sugar dehydrogenase [Paludibacter sp.]